jgi:hypothetical protein
MDLNLVLIMSCSLIVIYYFKVKPLYYQYSYNKKVQRCTTNFSVHPSAMRIDELKKFIQENKDKKLLQIAQKRLSLFK